MRFPDPRLIPISAMIPPAIAPVLTSQTRLSRPGANTLYPVHDHCAFVHNDNSGNTSVVASHFHRVVRGKVQPDPSDGHTHDLTGYACGPGAGRPNLA